MPSVFCLKYEYIVKLCATDRLRHSDLVHSAMQRSHSSSTGETQLNDRRVTNSPSLREVRIDTTAERVRWDDTTNDSEAGSITQKAACSYPINHNE